MADSIPLSALRKTLLSSEIATKDWTNGNFTYLSTTLQLSNEVVEGLSNIVVPKLDTISSLVQDEVDRVDAISGTLSTFATPSDISAAINTLDGVINGSAGAGKTLTAFSQADGKVTAGFGNISILTSQISNFPTIPTVNDGTLKIQKNGSDVATFTANQSNSVTANITVPLSTSQLANDSGYLTSSDLDLAKVMEYQGTVTTYADLPANPKKGAVYDVISAYNDNPPGTNYAWNGTTWDPLGGTIDTSVFALTSDLFQLSNETLNGISNVINPKLSGILSVVQIETDRVDEISSNVTALSAAVPLSTSQLVNDSGFLTTEIDPVFKNWLSSTNAIAIGLGSSSSTPSNTLANIAIGQNNSNTGYGNIALGNSNVNRANNNWLIGQENQIKADKWASAAIFNTIIGSRISVDVLGTSQHVLNNVILGNNLSVSIPAATKLKNKLLVGGTDSSTQKTTSFYELVDFKTGDIPHGRLSAALANYLTAESEFENWLSGNKIYAGTNASVTADNGIAIGADSYTSNGIAIGLSARTINRGIAIGHGAGTAYGSLTGNTAGIAIGLSSYAYGNSIFGYSTALGRNAIASGANGALALGTDAIASATGAIQLGAGTNNQTSSLQVFDYQLLNSTGDVPYARLSTSLSSYALTSNLDNYLPLSGGILTGETWSATNRNSIFTLKLSTGENLLSGLDFNVAIGRGSYADCKQNNSSIAIGLSATSNKNGGIAIGSRSYTNGASAIAVGANTSALTSYAIQLGKGTNSNISSLQVFDYQLLDSSGKVPFDRMLTGTASNTVAVGDHTHSQYALTSQIPLSTSQLINNSGYLTAESDPIFNDWLSGNKIYAGTNAVVNNNGGIAIGEDAIANSNSSPSFGIAIGKKANATAAGGYPGIAIGYSSYAGFGNNVALGTQCSADIGSGSSTGAHSTAIGSRAYTKANVAIALGYQASATANYAIQIGKGNNNQISTFQIYDWPLLDSSGNIPEARVSSIGYIKAADVPLSDYTPLSTTNALSLEVVNGISVEINPKLDLLNALVADEITNLETLSGQLDEVSASLTGYFPKTGGTISGNTTVLGTQFKLSSANGQTTIMPGMSLAFFSQNAGVAAGSIHSDNISGLHIVTIGETNDTQDYYFPGRKGSNDDSYAIIATERYVDQNRSILPIASSTASSLQLSAAKYVYRVTDSGNTGTFPTLVAPTDVIGQSGNYYYSFEIEWITSSAAASFAQLFDWINYPEMQSDGQQHTYYITGRWDSGGSGNSAFTMNCWRVK